MITWIVENSSSERRKKWNAQISLACSATSTKYVEIQIVPFERSVVGGDPVTSGFTVAYGSTAIFDVVKRNNWNPGIFTIGNESYVFSALGDDYLNSDMKVLSVDQAKEFIKENSHDFFFIKPDTDTKSFDGTVVDAGRFDFFIEQHQQFSGYDFNSKICISSVKDIDKEWRLFVVAGKIISWSQYLEKRRFKTSTNIDPAAIKFAYSVIEKYNPCAAFVIDIAKIGEKYKVVEYNTFNHSGFYECDINSIIKVLNKELLK